MEKNARITIKGTQKPKNEEAQTVEFITRGKLQRYGAKLRVSYEESDLIGMNGVTLEGTMLTLGAQTSVVLK